MFIKQWPSKEYNQDDLMHASSRNVAIASASLICTTMETQLGAELQKYLAGELQDRSSP